MALVSDLSPSLAESVDTAQRKVQEARPSLNPVDGVAAARHALLSAFLVQPAHAGQLCASFVLCIVLVCTCLVLTMPMGCFTSLNARVDASVLIALGSCMVCTCKLHAAQPTDN